MMRNNDDGKIKRLKLLFYKRFNDGEWRSTQLTARLMYIKVQISIGLADDKETGRRQRKRSNDEKRKREELQKNNYWRGKNE